MSYNKSKPVDYEAIAKKYEQRMRDLVEAYKCLQKEKETLELTVKSLTSKNSIVKSSPPNDMNSSDLEVDREIERLKNQVLTLSQSISNLTEEKREMINKFLNDKRVTRDEYEMKIAELSKDKHQLAKEIDDKIKIKTVELENELIDYKQHYQQLEEQLNSERDKNEERIAVMENNVAILSRSIGQLQQENQQLHHQITESKFNNSNTTNPSSIYSSYIKQHNTPDILQCVELEIIDKDDILRTVKRFLKKLNEIDSTYEMADLVKDYPSRPSGIKKVDADDRSDVDRSSNAENPDSSVAEESTKVKLMNLQQQLDTSNALIEDMRAELQAKDIIGNNNVKNLRDEIIKLEWANKRQINQLRIEYDQQIMELQNELTQHRNRTVALIAEKDDTIRHYQSLATGSHQSTGKSNDEPQSQSRHSRSVSVTDNCHLYQCRDYKARIEQESRKLRQEKRNLNTELHRLESDNQYLKQHRPLSAPSYSDEPLQSVTKEYLRNIIRNLLLYCHDKSVKKSLVRAITQVLEFPQDEVDKLLQKY